MHSSQDTFNKAVCLFRKEKYLEAQALFKQALEEGYGPAARFLGKIAEDGLLNKPNREEALQVYLSGAELGDARCKYYAGILFAKNDNFEKAVALLEDAAKQKVLLAHAVLGFWYREGKYIDRNRAKALFNLRLASAYGHIEATGAYANILRHKGGITNHLRSICQIPRAVYFLIKFGLFVKNDDVFEVSSKVLSSGD